MEIVRLVAAGVDKHGRAVRGIAKTAGEFRVSQHAEFGRSAGLVKWPRAAGIARQATSGRVVGTKLAEVVRAADVPQIAVLGRLVVPQKLRHARGKRVTTDIAEVRGKP